MPPSPESAPAGVTPLTRSLAGWVTGAALTAATVIALALVPRSAGSSWAQVVSAARAVEPEWMAALTVVWVAGLAAHSMVLTSSLPGLSARRAMSLNLAGSAVANAVPLGGALSMGLTSSMVRSWGFAPLSTATFFTVSNAWNLLGRLMAGALAMGWIVWTLPTASALVGAGLATAACAVLLAAATLTLASAHGAARTGAAAGALLAAIQRARRHRQSASPPGVQRDLRRSAGLALLRARRDVLHLVRASWRRLSIGMVGYLALLALLLLLCLRTFGDPSSFALAAAAVGVERLVTAVPITPGGAGVGEIALIGCLTAGGVDPIVAVCVALTYRVFTFFLEIPVGLAVAGVWGLTTRRRAPVRPALAAAAR